MRLRPTRRGWLIGLGGLAWCGFAAWAGQHDLWWPGMFATGLSLAGLAVVGLACRRRPNLERRITPQLCPQDGSVEVELSVRDADSPLPVRRQLRESLPPVLGDAGWADVTSSATVGYQFTATLRGRHSIGPAAYRVSDWLGLAAGESDIGLPDELLVTPRTEPLAGILGSRSVGRRSDTESILSATVGADDTMVRSYSPGDELRRIHWRSTARAGELMVRREAIGRSLSATLLIDDRRRSYSADDPEPRLEWILSAAASLGLHLLAEGRTVNLLSTTGQLSIRPSERSSSDRLLIWLADVERSDERELPNPLPSSGRGSRSRIVFALLGQLSRSDLHSLGQKAPQGAVRQALIVPGESWDEQFGLTLGEAGWNWTTADPDEPISAGLRRLSGRALR